MSTSSPPWFCVEAVLTKICTGARFTYIVDLVAESRGLCRAHCPPKSSVCGSSSDGRLAVLRQMANRPENLGLERLRPVGREDVVFIEAGSEARLCASKA